MKDQETNVPTKEQLDDCYEQVAASAAKTFGENPQACHFFYLRLYEASAKALGIDIINEVTKFKKFMEGIREEL